MKRLKKLTAFVTVLNLLVMLLTGNKAYSQTNRLKSFSYVGEIKTQTFINKNKVPWGGNLISSSYLYHNYLLERSTLVKHRSTTEIGQQGMEIKTTELPTDTLFRGYLLSNLKSRRCIFFDTSLSNLSIKDSYPLKKKKEGIQFDYMPADISQYTYWKDSLLNGKKAILMKRTSNIKQKNGDSVRFRDILFIDPNLKKFPIHSSRKYWDKKYIGFVFRLDRVQIGNSKNPSSAKVHSYSFRYQFTPGLTSDKIIQIKRFIKTAKAYEEGLKN